MELISSRGGLDERVNGEGLSRGELYLTLDELRWIQLQVGPEYGFVLSPTAPKPQKQRRSKGRAESEVEEKSVTRSGASASNKRQRTCSISGKAPTSSNPGLSEDKGNCVSSEISFEGKTTRQSSGNRASLSHDPASRGDGSGASSIGGVGSVSAVDLKNVKLIDFKAFSLGLLDKLGKIPGSRWFLQPVDPELDGVPDYFSVIENPMDFQTIREKLVQNMYKNPFGWQLDMRLVFYNALRYHKEGNAVREDALSLAIEFESKCKEIKEVNPYYYSILQEKRETPSALDLDCAEGLQEKLATLDPYILSKLYSLLAESGGEVRDLEDSSRSLPEMIMSVLRLKPKVVRDQIVLLVESIIQVEQRYQHTGRDRESAGASSRSGLPEDDEDDDNDVAMTPSSEGSILEDERFSKDPDVEDFVGMQSKEESGSQRDGPMSSSIYSNEDDQEAYGSAIHEKEILSSFSSGAFPIPPQESAWGEWKAKVIHNSTLTQRENAPKKSKREREAEQADAEI